jgi:hypothetical protein
MVQMTQQGFVHSPLNCPYCSHPITTKDVNDAFSPPTVNLTPKETKITIVWPPKPSNAPWWELIGEDTDMADGLYRVKNGKIRKLE